MNDHDKIEIDLEKLGNTEVRNNGCLEVENNGDHEFVCDVKVLPSVENKSEASASASPSSTVRKGKGLKKWRRIKRDVIKSGDSSDVDTEKTVMQEVMNASVNPSKRAQVYAEKPEKSEGSVSSTSPTVGGLDVFALLGSNSGFAIGPSNDAGTDSENSEDQSSKSSTAASVPKMKYEVPVIVGFPHDKMRMKNLTHTVMKHDQQGKRGRIESMKKARGERVKLEKENSQSSIESDSRSSSFVFTQPTYTTRNGIQSERPINHAGENGEHRERLASNGLRGDYGRDGDADSSCEGRKERNENHGSSSDQDPLVESIFALQTAQEALEQEVLKLKEINKDASVDDSVSEFTNLQQNLPETSSEQVEKAKRDLEKELEDILKLRVDAEAEYLAILRSVEKLDVTSADPITPSESQKAPDSDQTQMPAAEDETSKIQKKVCKYTSYFFVQVLLFLFIVAISKFELSTEYVDVVPT